MKLRSEIKSTLKTNNNVRWEIATGLTPYETALARMDDEVAAIAQGGSELIWLVEHPPIYTAGTSAKAADLVDATRFPVYETGRGGQYTYHGPGQRVGYVMIDLKKRGNDVRAFVAGLEDVIIGTLADFDIAGERCEDRVGVWVRRGQREDKIAALGIRVRRGIGGLRIARHRISAKSSGSGVRAHPRHGFGNGSAGVLAVRSRGLPVIQIKEHGGALRSG